MAWSCFLLCSLFVVDSGFEGQVGFCYVLRKLCCIQRLCCIRRGCGVVMFVGFCRGVFLWQSVDVTIDLFVVHYRMVHYDV